MKTSTYTTQLNEKVLAKHRQGTYKTLRDTVSPLLYFRYSKNRESGTFYLVKRPGKGANAAWIKLGRWPDITIKTAREACQVKLNRLLTEKPLSPDDTKPLSRLYELLDWYDARKQKQRELSDATKANTHAAIKRIKRIMPDRPIRELSKAVVNEQLFEPMLANYRLSTFDVTLKNLKAAFAQAYRLEMIKVDPVAACSYKAFTTTLPPPRQGRLDESKIKQLFRTLKTRPLKERMLSIWLLMHGTRISETVCANMDRISNGFWEIRESESKTQLNIIPLTPIAEVVLQRYRYHQRKQGYRGSYLFPQKRSNRKPIGGSHASNMIRAATGLSPHDYRKRARTWWAHNGVDYFIGELLLGHKIKDLDATYIQNIAIPATRDALALWQNYLVSQGMMELLKTRY